ncbi:hypothetical protein RRG08_028588 [Elysia crispata]|uniref:Uncharacterized protein n=1 Tax=Elysia crispata TaxID=231223 RepID=A0AAE1DM64_9GAST|nr:hypothetical protein RRG08_028588 [Elysia crispata]
MAFQMFASMLCLSSLMWSVVTTRSVQREPSMIYTYERGMPFFCTFGTKEAVEKGSMIGAVQEDCFLWYKHMVYYTPDGTPMYPFLKDGSPGGFVLNCTSHIKHGRINESCNRLIHSRCSFLCDPWYRPVVDSLTCDLTEQYSNISAIWSYSDPCIQQRCTANISHGKLNKPCHPLIHATCGITCDFGYDPDVDSVTCNQGGTSSNSSAVWSHSNPCKPKAVVQTTWIKSKSWIWMIPGILVGALIVIGVKKVCCGKNTGMSSSSSEDSLRKKEVHIPLIHEANQPNAGGQAGEGRDEAVCQSTNNRTGGGDHNDISLDSNPSNIFSSNIKPDKGFSDKHFIEYPSGPDFFTRCKQDSIQSEACDKYILRAGAESLLSSLGESSEPLEGAGGGAHTMSLKKSVRKCNENVNSLYKCTPSQMEYLLVMMEPRFEESPEKNLEGYVLQTPEQRKRLGYFTQKCFDVSRDKHNQPRQYFAKEILHRMAAQGDTVRDLLDYFENRNPPLVQWILKLHACQECRDFYGYKDLPSSPCNGLIHQEGESDDLCLTMRICDGHIHLEGEADDCNFRICDGLIQLEVEKDDLCSRICDGLAHLKSETDDPYLLYEDLQQFFTSGRICNGFLHLEVERPSSQGSAMVLYAWKLRQMTFSPRICNSLIHLEIERPSSQGSAIVLYAWKLRQMTFFPRTCNGLIHLEDETDDLFPKDLQWSYTLGN